MKKSRFFSFINKITPLVDLLLLWLVRKHYVASDERQDQVIALLLLVAMIYVCYRWGKAFYLVITSKSRAEEYLLSNRVIPICGKQRVGKSSLGSYFANVMSTSVYSNIPLRVKGKMTKKLNSEILTCRNQIEDGSVLVVDEASLFYNNVKSDREDDNIFGQAVLCQCLGHFFDGNILYISVDVNRLPKPIRDNYSAKLQVVESQSYKYSLFGDILLSLFVKLVLKERRVFTGLRVWKAQHYEFICEEQYISLLGDKNNEFSPMLTFATFQNFGLSTYDDRYMRAYYQDKPVNKDEYWESLIINKQDFELLYDGAVIAYLNNINKENEQKKSRVIIKDKTE